MVANGASQPQPQPAAAAADGGGKRARDALAYTVGISYSQPPAKRVNRALDLSAAELDAMAIVNVPLYAEHHPTQSIGTVVEHHTLDDGTAVNRWVYADDMSARMIRQTVERDGYEALSLKHDVAPHTFADPRALEVSIVEVPARNGTVVFKSQREALPYIARIVRSKYASQQVHDESPIAALIRQQDAAATAAADTHAQRIAALHSSSSTTATMATQQQQPMAVEGNGDGGIVTMKRTVTPPAAAAAGATQQQQAAPPSGGQQTAAAAATKTPRTADGAGAPSTLVGGGAAAPPRQHAPPAAAGDAGERIASDPYAIASRQMALIEGLDVPVSQKRALIEAAKASFELISAQTAAEKARNAAARVESDAAVDTMSRSLVAVLENGKGKALASDRASGLARDISESIGKWMANDMPALKEMSKRVVVAASAVQMHESAAAVGAAGPASAGGGDGVAAKSQEETHAYNVLLNSFQERLRTHARDSGVHAAAPLAPRRAQPPLPHQQYNAPPAMAGLAPQQQQRVEVSASALAQQRAVDMAAYTGNGSEYQPPRVGGGSSYLSPEMDALFSRTDTGTYSATRAREMAEAYEGANFGAHHAI
jgi:hypothetical protein